MSELHNTTMSEQLLAIKSKVAQVSDEGEREHRLVLVNRRLRKRVEELEANLKMLTIQADSQKSQIEALKLLAALQSEDPTYRERKRCINICTELKTAYSDEWAKGSRNSAAKYHAMKEAIKQIEELKP